MLTPRVRIDESRQYAMGWFVRPLSEAVDPAAQNGPPAQNARNNHLPVLLEHQGEWGNTHTYAAMLPASRLGIALVINGNDTSAPSRLKAIDSNILRILHGQSPVPTVVREDWLQRNGWVVSSALLLAEVGSFILALAILPRRRPLPSGTGLRNKWQLILLGAAALGLDAFLVWLSFNYAPTHFETHLAVIVRQFPDIGVTLVPALALAVLWSVPRTIWVLEVLFPNVRRRLRRGRQGVAMGGSLDHAGREREPKQ
jgi:hypothetical protein